MKFYITFGQIHRHKLKGKIFDKDCVAVIECRNYSEGRAKAFAFFGRKFASTYDEKSFTESIMEYYPRGLIHI